MTKSANDIIEIARNVTGRVDASDPLFSQQKMLQYLNDFLQLEMAQEIRITQQESWMEFDLDETGDNPLPIDLQNPPGTGTYYPIGTQFTMIGPPAYVQILNATPPDSNNSFEMWWYQSPEQFYWRWPEGQEYQPQRPTDVLWYPQVTTVDPGSGPITKVRNALTFRGPLDQLYHFKIQAYQVSYDLASTASIIESDYLWRYIAYGMSLDIFSDYGELDQWNNYFPIFRRYRAMVQARTASQLANQRSLPRF